MSNNNNEEQPLITLIEEYEIRFGLPVPGFPQYGLSNTSLLREKLEKALASGEPVKEWNRKQSRLKYPSKPGPIGGYEYEVPQLSDSNTEPSTKPEGIGSSATTTFKESGEENPSKKLPNIGIGWDLSADDDLQDVIKNTEAKRNQRKRYRDLKARPATADDPIYSYGIVIGGQRLGESKPISSLENPEDDTVEPDMEPGGENGDYS